MQITVEYCSNYNGCYLFSDVSGHWTNLGMNEHHKEAANKCIKMITDHAGAKCTEEGYFCGSVVELSNVCEQMIKSVFGDHVEVEFNEDRISG